MPQWLVALLIVLFGAHLVVFARLAMRGRGIYHWLLTVLFLALTASFTLRLLAPDWQLAGQPVHLLLRYVAWGLAVVTVPLLITRVVRRRRSGRATRAGRR